MPKLPIPYGDQPAFPGDTPVEWYDNTDGTKRTAAGLTVRDYLAAQALVGVLVSNAGAGPSAVYATAAYELADAMLAASIRTRANAGASTPSS